jgi:hypothetical protein
VDELDKAARKAARSVYVMTATWAGSEATRIDVPTTPKWITDLYNFMTLLNLKSI